MASSLVGGTPVPIKLNAECFFSFYFAAFARDSAKANAATL